MFQEPTRLLRVCEPYNDESLFSFIIRLAKFNSYERPYVLSEIAQMHKYRAVWHMVFSHKTNLQKLSDLTGIAEANLRSLTYPDIDGKSERVLFNGQVVYRNLFKNWPAKLCPECLAQESYHRQIWDIASYTTCAEHGIPLIDRCPECNKRITWTREEINFCACGFDFTKVVSPELPQGDRKVFEHINSLVYQGYYSSGQLQHLSIGSLLRLIDFMAAQLAGQCDTRGLFLSQKSLSVRNKCVIEAYKIFDDWPNNFIQFLGNVKNKEKVGSRYCRTTGLVKDFGTFYIPLYQSFTEPEFEFIQQEFQEYLKKWDGGYVRKGDLPYSEDVREDMQFTGINEASRILQVAPKRIIRFLEAGYLTGSVVEQGGTTLYRIDNESIKKFKELFKSALSRTDVAQILGIGGMSVIELAKAGLIKLFMGKTVHEDDYKWLFLPGDVQEFIDRIRLSVKADDSGSSSISFQEAMDKLNAVQYSYADVISSIFVGKIVPCAAGESGRLLDLKFAEDHINELMNCKFNDIKGDSLSLDEAAQELRVKQKSMRIWLRRGLLKGTPPKANGQRWWSISREAIEEFKSDYVIIAPIARHHKLSPGKLVRVLTEAGVNAVSGPAIDKCLQYIYLKSDIERAGYNTDFAWDTSESYRGWSLGKVFQK